MYVGVDVKTIPIQVLGKSRKEAEQAFMEVAVDVEEREALNQEIKEAAIENRRDTKEDNGDEWRRIVINKTINQVYSVYL